jgi:hypothetical protein
MSEHINTEGPTSGASAPAGGSDPAKEAAIAAQGEVKDGEAKGTPAGNREPENRRPGAEETRTTSGEEETPAATAAETGGDDDEETREPTDEEQKEIDDMVDYTVTEETEDQFPDLPDGTPVKAGDTVKLPKDHPLVTGGTETQDETAQ